MDFEKVIRDSSVKEAKPSLRVSVSEGLVAALSQRDRRRGRFQTRDDGDKKTCHVVFTGPDADQSHHLGKYQPV